MTSNQTHFLPTVISVVIILILIILVVVFVIVCQHKDRRIEVSNTTQIEPHYIIVDQKLTIGTKAPAPNKDSMNVQDFNYKQQNLYENGVWFTQKKS